MEPSTRSTHEWFDDLVSTVESPLRHALVGAYGPDVGREAAAETLAWAWEHPDRVRTLDNPGGYLYRVGQTAAKRLIDRRNRSTATDLTTWSIPDEHVPADVEPGLIDSLASLTEHQRQAVLLVHAHGHTLQAAADVLGVSISTLRNHLRRGVERLRTDLGVTDA